MLKQPDAADFIHAMIKEADDHESRDHWDVAPRWEKPLDVKAILAIWDFKRQRFPDGRINKHKARLCAHGGMQQYGVNYWENLITNSELDQCSFSYDCYTSTQA